MTGGQKTALTWLGIAAGGLVLYFLVKKQVAGAASAVSSSVGGAIASPFESLFTSITGMSPTPIVPVNQSPSTATCYAVDANGNVVYDSSGNIVQQPCAPGHIGTTPYTG